MRFLRGNPIFNDENPNDFRCQTDTVSAQRLTEADLIGTLRLDVLIDILSELTWAFWQTHAEHPAADLKQYLERVVREMGRI
jgi:hypothetical protein